MGNQGRIKGLFGLELNNFVGPTGALPLSDNSINDKFNVFGINKNILNNL